MDKVVVRGLAPNPADRYPDVRTFLTALGASTVVPATEAPAEASGQSCPNCGTEGQTGRFCRKCGYRLSKARPAAPRPPSPKRELTVEETVLDEPIQITSVDVGRVHVGAGIVVGDTAIATHLEVASQDLDVEFPEPLDMPKLDVRSWSVTDQELAIAMPEPPDMPVLDWAEVAPPMPQVPTIKDDVASEESD
jgi:hypothetical protein